MRLALGNLTGDRGQHKQDYLTVHATAKVVDKKLVGKWAVVGSDSAGEFSLERVLVPEKK